ncbi:MAG TPA: hypothetical protein VF373_03700 [Prolixibacteraceae bacterium]
MKTKISTLTLLSALGIIGLLNINAIADNSKTVNTETATVGIEILASVVRLNETTLIYSPEAFTGRDIDAEIEKHVTKEALPKENTEVEANLPDSAKTITASEADEQISKYADKMVALAQARSKK